MTVLREIELTCWVCEEAFTRQEPRKYAVTGRGSDLCPQPFGESPLPLLLHTCPTCGFTADGRGFQPSQFDEGVQAWILAGGLSRIMAQRRETDYVRYELAALCHGRRREPSPLQLGEYYLAASWLAQLEAAPDVVPDYQAEAARHLEHALLADEMEDGERAVMTYLVGELRRRLGEFDAALRLFDEAAVLFPQHGGPNWLLHALGQQAKLAKERSTETARLPE